MKSRRLVESVTAVLILASALFMAGARALAAEGAHAPLPEATDLASDVRDAAASGRAVVVFFSAPGCPWCMRARRDYLVPLSKSADGPPRVILRELGIDSGEALIAPSGERTTRSRWARSLGIRFTPVTLFLGPDGKEAAPRIVGYPGSDFYGGYVEERIEMARKGPNAR